MLSFLPNIFSGKTRFKVNYPVCATFEAAQRELDRVGFAIIQLMDAEQHAAFLADSEAFLRLFYEKHPDIDFLAIGRSEFPEVRNASNAVVRGHLEPVLPRFLEGSGYDIIYGTHLLKSNNNKSVLNPHQDSSHVDESRFNSFHFWMPVTAPAPDFGTLEVIPYSHKLHIPYRSLNIPWGLSPHEKDLWKFMVPVHVQPGQAILFNSNLIHASGENKSDKIRIAVNSLIKPAEADFVHCYTDEASGFRDIEIYKITPEFYYNENIMERPKGYELLKTVSNTNRDYTLEELRTVFKNHAL